MENQPSNSTIEERLVDIFRQIQKYIGLVQQQQDMVMKMAVAIDTLTGKWCPDINRVVDSHADDLEGLKASSGYRR